MNELISVVIPVYNVEDYLEECLKSIIGQSYKNLEIILVDDGSTDNSYNLCEKFLFDKRVKLFKKSNGGLSDARNYGIRRSTGKYICFIDSDDFVSNEYVETLYNLIKKYDAQVSICKFARTSNDVCVFSKRKKTKVMRKDKALREMFYQKRFDTSAWGKMYLKSLFNEICYPLNKYFEDLYTTYKLIEKSKKIIFNVSVLYAYRVRQNSIMNDKFSIKLLDYIEINEILYKHFKNQKKVIKSVIARCSVNYLNLLLRVNQNYFKSVYVKSYEFLKNNFFTLQFSNAKFFVKIAAFIVLVFRINGIRFLKKIRGF